MHKNLFLPIIANIFGKLSTRNFHIRKKNSYQKKGRAIIREEHYIYLKIKVKQGNVIINMQLRV